MTAPVGEVSSATARGRNGIGRLRLGSNAPSTSSRRLSSSSRARSLPMSSNSIWSTLNERRPVLFQKSMRPRKTNTWPSSGSVVTRRALSAKRTASILLKQSWMVKLKTPVAPFLTPVRSLTVGLHAGVEAEFAAAQPPRLLDHPVHQRRRVALPAMPRQRRQIVAVQGVTPGEIVVDAKPGRGHRLLASLDEESDQPVAGGALNFVHEPDEVVGRADVWAQLEHRFGCEMGFSADELSDQPPIWDMFFAGFTKPGWLIR